MSSIEDLEASPKTSYAAPYSFTPPQISAVPTTPHVDYEFGVQTSPFSQPSPPQWNPTEDRRGPDFYAPSSSDTANYSQTFSYTNPLDSAYTGYDSSADLAMAGLSMSPPSSAFAATGLPFRGLDYIRNYNQGGYPASEEDSLWQSYDPGAFGFDPDLPFTLGDIAPLEIHDPAH